MATEKTYGKVTEGKYGPEKTQELINNFEERQRMGAFAKVIPNEEKKPSSRVDVMSEPDRTSGIVEDAKSPKPLSTSAQRTDGAATDTQKGGAQKVDTETTAKTKEEAPRKLPRNLEEIQNLLDPDKTGKVTKENAEKAADTLQQVVSNMNGIRRFGIKNELEDVTPEVAKERMEDRLKLKLESTEVAKVIQGAVVRGANGESLVAKGSQKGGAQVTADGKDDEEITTGKDGKKQEGGILALIMAVIDMIADSLGFKRKEEPKDTEVAKKEGDKGKSAEGDKAEQQKGMEFITNLGADIQKQIRHAGVQANGVGTVYSAEATGMQPQMQTVSAGQQQTVVAAR